MRDAGWLLFSYFVCPLQGWCITAKGGPSRTGRGRLTVLLATQAEALDERTVARDISVMQVAQQALATADQRHQTTTGVVVMLVLLEVFGQVKDALGEHRYLDLRRTGVTVNGGVCLHDVLLDSGV